MSTDKVFLLVQMKGNPPTEKVVAVFENHSDAIRYCDRLQAVRDELTKVGSAALEAKLLERGLEDCSLELGDFFPKMDLHFVVETHTLSRDSSTLTRKFISQSRAEATEAFLFDVDRAVQEVDGEEARYEPSITWLLQRVKKDLRPSATKSSEAELLRRHLDIVLDSWWRACADRSKLECEVRRLRDWQNGPEAFELSPAWYAASKASLREREAELKSILEMCKARPGVSAAAAVRAVIEDRETLEIDLSRLEKERDSLAKAIERQRPLLPGQRRVKLDGTTVEIMRLGDQEQHGCSIRWVDESGRIFTAIVDHDVAQKWPLVDDD